MFFARSFELSEYRANVVANPQQTNTARVPRETLKTMHIQTSVK